MEKEQVQKAGNIYQNTNKRNKVIQLIAMKDGSVRKIMHDKKFSTPQYADRQSIWRQWNAAPKPNSKSQQRKRA